ncbi:MAG: MobF family relaxase [Euzebya sp.]
MLGVWAVTVSMRVMSAGTGYRYLLHSVAVGDGRREPGRALADYYTQPGCPPGRWLGSGLGEFADGQLHTGDVVTETQLALLLGAGCDPVNGAPLGRAYPVYPTRAERIAARIGQLDGSLTGEDRAAAVARIEAEEASRATRRAVAGFDVTFSVPKSVSVLWALADPDTQARILAAHHAAIADVIGMLERDVAATRMGANGPEGAVAQVPVVGVAAVAFDHFDSRAGDPQLHTHVVIATKVRTVTDGKWRSLDGRPVHAAMVALSEHYNAVLADHLTRDLGVVWQQRERGLDRNPVWEIAGVPAELVAAFSSRAGSIDVATDRLIAEYRQQHGRQPSRRTVIRLRQQATLSSRPDKVQRSLADLTEDWRTRATVVLGRPADGWAIGLLRDGRRVQQLLTADALGDRLVAGVAGRVVEVVGERRSTWRRWNLHAEASRQLAGVRFATTADRDAVVGRVVAAAEQQSVRLTPPDLAVVPAELRRADGTSVLRPRHAAVFTSAELLAAEDRLLDLGRTTVGPVVPRLTVAETVAAGMLGADQAAAVTAVATSGRVVDVLIGPAGAGKTTAMRTLHAVWTGLYGQQSVIGLAPSAAAAQVLADDTGVQADTLAKWLHDHQHGTTRFTAGQLVIIDEASLAGTRSLHAIADHAAQVGAKVLLVGDPAQLTAVDAGGALRLLARDRDDIVELTDVRRFHQPWEATATLQLRNGNPAVLGTYAEHGRLHDGDTETMLDSAYAAWQTDQETGKQSLLIAPTRDQVRLLNLRAQTDRITIGHVQTDVMVALRDGTTAGAGDVIVTRRNDRRLHGPGGWVRNGDRWRITATHPDGTIDVRRHGQHATMRLPAAYVAAHVELGYATTVHRAQGATVDTAHALVTAAMTRETLYVAMTRGRQSNLAYTITDAPDTEAHQDHPPTVTGRQALTGVLARSGAEPSAHEVIAVEQDRWGSIAQLVAEYDTIAAAAQHGRWVQLLRTSGLTPTQAEQTITSEAFGPLCAALRRADAHHHNPEQLLPRLIAARPLEDAEDIAAVLHHRLQPATQRTTAKGRPRPVPRLIAGLIPQATGPMTHEMRTALDERQQLIERRATKLAHTAHTNNEAWTRPLGPAPTDLYGRRTWIRDLAIIAVYRDLHTITSDTPIGHRTEGMQAPDTRAALTAIRRLQQAAIPDWHRAPVAGVERPYAPDWSRSSI